ncbi:type II toxin-antitoxin system VapC family toxin [Streptosporangium sp. NPDC087985]|uniref:type II toxin-antitoxin system VapC family toxin n=1 Tax=Streptosporangium sp. NPDC087985 TaxID=3366196 RepID=UPI0038030509
MEDDLLLSALHYVATEGLANVMDISEVQLTEAKNACPAAHKLSAHLLSTLSGRLLLPVTVLTERSWHVEKNLGAKSEAAFLASVARGELELVDLMAEDVGRTARLVEIYDDLRLGLVDASVIALAERLEISKVATIDCRHFTAVRPRHVMALTLLPETL